MTQHAVHSPDTESGFYLKFLQEKERLVSNKVPDVHTILVVFSSAGMVFDPEAIRQKISMTYPGAAVFFRNTDGKSWGAKSPKKIDLLIDLTGPGQRQPWFYSRKLRHISKVAVGRNAGFFRKSIYDRLYDEKAHFDDVPADKLARERFVQKEVFALVGVAMIPVGSTTADLGKSIALKRHG